MKRARRAGWERAPAVISHEDHTPGIGQYADRAYYENHIAGVRGISAEAARAYVEAHPEAKPWQDAKPGEVWVLTLPDEGDADAEIVTVATTYGTFTAGSLREWTLNDDRIISARQVPTGGAA